MGNRKYTVNDDFFKAWSRDMAYIFGFWIADGWIDKDRFYISQSTKRKYILEKILEKMGSNYPIRDRKWGVSYFAITSKDIIRDIISLGGEKRKSLIIKFPEIPKEYLHDFIRGYFDGDGCICKAIDKRRTMRSKEEKFNYIISFTSGSKDFSYSLLQILKEEISGFNGRMQIKREDDKIVNGVLYRHNSNTYVICGGQNDARRYV